jgi:hypothetical protein
LDSEKRIKKVKRFFKLANKLFPDVEIREIKFTNESERLREYLLQDHKLEINLDICESILQFTESQIYNNLNNKKYAE